MVCEAGVERTGLHLRPVSLTEPHSLTARDAAPLSPSSMGVAGRMGTEREQEGEVLYPNFPLVTERNKTSLVGSDTASKSEQSEPLSAQYFCIL